MKFQHGWARMCLGMLVLLLGACATPEPPPLQVERKLGSYVVLLDNADGSVGAITVTGAKGKVLVDRLAQGASLDGGSAFAVEESRIRRDFGEALSARPIAPVSFLLYFETGGAQLTPASQALIAQVIATAKSRPAADVSVTGHTDTEGDAEFNEKLGLQRAQAIAKMVPEAGLDVAEMTVNSHGKRNLLVPTPDNTAEPKNRRVEISIR